MTDWQTLDFSDSLVLERVKGGFTVITPTENRRIAEGLAEFLDTAEMPGRDLRNSPDWSGHVLSASRGRMEAVAMAISHLSRQDTRTAMPVPVRRVLILNKDPEDENWLTTDLCTSDK